jgi:hypothetical protein
MLDGHIYVNKDKLAYTLGNLSDRERDYFTFLFMILHVFHIHIVVEIETDKNVENNRFKSYFECSSSEFAIIECIFYYDFPGDGIKILI